jgi:hypothetical protein
MKSKMRALVIVTFALLMSMGLAGKSHAGTVYEDGCLVPYAFYGDSDNTLVTLNVYTANTGNSIYWSYFSADGVLLSNGSLPIQSSTWAYNFSLKDKDGNNHPNTQGYLVFTIDNTGVLETGEDRQELSGAAFLWSTGDAAFLPVVPLTRSDYANVDLTLDNLNAASITDLSYGFSSTSATVNKYWIEAAYSAVTQLVIWTSQNPSGAFTGNISTISGDPLQNITINATHTRLNVVNVASDVAGIPLGYYDGGLYIIPNGGDRFMFSIVESSGVAARQTVLGNEYP